MFKVGDKVTCLTRGKGIVYRITQGTYGVEVDFGGSFRSYSHDGKHYVWDLNTSLYHGHGTFKIEFVEDKETEYEWQWLIQRDGVFDTSYFYENKEELKKDLSEDIKILYRIEESKREVKHG